MAVEWLGRRQKPVSTSCRPPLLFSPSPSKMSSTDAPRRSSSRIATRSSASHSAAPAAGVAQPKKRAVPAKTDAQSAPVKKAKSEASAPLLGNGDVAAKAGTLTVGERLPSITLQDESGKQIDVSTLKKSVIFTYVCHATVIR